MNINPVQIFQPRNWILLNFFLFFVVPTIVSLVFSGLIKGFGSIDVYGVLPVFILTIGIATGFVMVVIVIIRLFTPLKHARRQYKLINRADFYFGLLLMGVGSIATLSLAINGTSAGRSDLVSNLNGQVLYALSFFLTAGFFVVASYFLNHKKTLLATLVILIFSLSLIALGGRGRVLWPLLTLFAAHHISNDVPIKIRHLAIVSISLFILLSVLDSVYIQLIGQPSRASSGEFSIDAMLYQIFIQKRTFDGIFNLFLIIYEDPFPRTMRYIIEGPRETFMTYFFPAVLDAGVGFPATVPGTFWMVGGFWGVATGAIIYGVFSGLLARWYFATRSQLVLCFLLYEFSWVFNIGSSLFDHQAKIFVAGLAFFPFIIIRITTLCVR